MSVEVEIDADEWARTLPAAVTCVQIAAEAALAELRRSGDIAVLLTDDAAVRELNARFRGQDAATNVLAFPAVAGAGAAPGGETPLGDVALAFGVCAAEARVQGKPLAAHLQHLVVHGVLHLLGFDHEEDAQAQTMEDVERVILATLGWPDPYAVASEAVA